MDDTVWHKLIATKPSRAQNDCYALHALWESENVEIQLAYTNVHNYMQYNISSNNFCLMHTNIRKPNYD